jgi:tetratricopeptide (TPR) repeat protein
MSSSISADLEKKFDSYKKLLENRGYFKDVAEGTPAYAERLDKARGHFLAKYSQDTGAAAEKEKAKEFELSAEEKTRKAEAHKEKGNELLQNKRYAEAIAEYSAALALNSHSAVYHANRALALQRVNRFEDAVRDCRAALTIDPRYVKASVRLSQSLAELKRGEEASAAIDEALVLQPGNADLLKAREALKPASAPWANLFGANAGGMAGADGMGNPNPQQLPVGMPPMPPGAAGIPPSFMDMMTNPEFVRMAQQMVSSNPELMRVAEQMMRDPSMLGQMFQNMPGGVGGGFPGGGGLPPGAGMDLAEEGATIPPNVPEDEQ